MYKKKEILMIIGILGLTLILAFFPFFLSLRSSNVEEVDKVEEKQNTLNIYIKGELTVSPYTLVVPYGASYGYILAKINMYFNEYSIQESDLTKRYYEDATLVVLSSDPSAYNKDEISVEEIKDKIQISTASKASLMSLYGIGEKRAEKIIEYREKHELTSWEDLKQILGVSDDVMESIQEKAIL